MKNKRKFLIQLCLLVIVLLFAVTVSLCFGAAPIPISDTFSILMHKLFGISNEQFSNISISSINIVWTMRMPRVLLAVFVGAGLSLSGIVLQGTVQNPLAEPYLLGISSGAVLGATISVVGGFLAASSILAFVGSLLATVLVLALAGIKSKMTSSKLILSGVVINAMFTAASNFILSFKGDGDSALLIRYWTMGSLTKAKWDNILFPIITVVAISLFFLTQYRVLNTLLIGEEAARTLGINLAFYRGIYLVIMAFLVGILVASCGTIGFVGLIIPHIIRALVGSDHRKVVPLSLITGAIFLVIADAIARSLIKNADIPIGIITALIGAPLFAYMIIKKNYGFGNN